MNSPGTIDHSLEYIYDVYSPVIYGLAMQFTSDEKEAEKILMTSFKKISKLKLTGQGNFNLSLKIIQLTIETTYALFPNFKKTDLALKPFAKAPILYQLLCENCSLELLCRQFNLPVPQLIQNLRSELSLFSNVKKMYLVKAIAIPA